MTVADASWGLSGPDALRTARWMLLLAAIVFLISFEQGQLTGGVPLLHELFHDARHLLGFPCH
jgi:hypothetical protein